MKILLLDIETSPLTAYTWGLWNQNIPIKAIVDSGSVLCWAAKWLDQDEVMFSSILGGKKKMLQQMHKLLDTADCVVHYNGAKFDIPTLNKEFLLSYMSPPAPYQQLDLLKTARKKFRFPSNKLDFISKELGFKGKLEHEGFDLWIKCMNKDKEAWKRMEEYNKQDVITLQDVYYRFRPWIDRHVNYGIIDAVDHVCPTCGGHKVQRRGFNYTQAGKYQRYQCTECGAWSSDRRSEKISDGVIKCL